MGPALIGRSQSGLAGFFDVVVAAIWLPRWQYVRGEKEREEILALLLIFFSLASQQPRASASGHINLAYFPPSFLLSNHRATCR